VEAGAIPLKVWSTIEDFSEIFWFSLSDERLDSLNVSPGAQVAEVESSGSQVVDWFVNVRSESMNLVESKVGKAGASFGGSKHCCRDFGTDLPGLV
jgi:hypothetical protein